MLVIGIEAAALGTNCWIVADKPGGIAGHRSRRECIVIDPGVGVSDAVTQACEQFLLHPVAVALTHGHLDHTFSVVPVCDARGIPAYIHPDDRYQLADPWRGLAARRGTPLYGGLTFSEPDDVRLLVDGEPVLDGLATELGLTTQLSPGHTPGSVLFSTVSDDAPVLFTGDTLFAGAVGRTDLPGGSAADLTASLRRLILPAADDTVVYPGHGPATKIGHERHSNPYLRAVAAGQTL